jgi:hypothetical protein
MNLPDDHLGDGLSRLFRAAAQVPSGPMPPLAFGLETRAMAAWRASLATERSFWDMPLLMRGLLAAGAIMVISLWPAWNTSVNPFSDDLQLTDSTVASSDVTP